MYEAEEERLEDAMVLDGGLDICRERSDGKEGKESNEEGRRSGGERNNSMD